MYKRDMFIFAFHRAGLRAMFLVLALTAFMVAGCSTPRIKTYQIDVRVPEAAQGTQPLRARLVLGAADSLKSPNLSQSEGYILREKKPLTEVLLDAVAGRMQAAGIEPLEEWEASVSSGRLLIVLVRLEAKIDKSLWFAAAALRAERYTKDKRLVGRWEVVGRGSHQDSRLFAGGAGVAMGKAISQALNKLPWRSIAATR